MYKRQPKYHSVNAFSLLAHSCVFLCVHCQWCVSTVCICPLFTFIHSHYLTSTQLMHSLCWPIPVCPLSVVCVHSLYLSTVRFHTHTTLSSTQSMPSLCWSIQVYSCVSTVSVVCPRSIYVHCSLSYTHYLSTTQSMPSLCWPIPVCPLSVLCVHSLYIVG